MEVTAVRQRWGKNVRQKREAGRQTQGELAARVGCSQAAISRIELGQQEIPLKLGLSIAAALETTYDALFAVGEEVA